MRKSTFRNDRALPALLISAFLLFGWAGSSSAQITMRADNPTVGQIIETVKAQTDYNFFYDSDLAEVRANGVSADNASLTALLNEAFRGRDLDYRIEDMTCFIFRKEETRNSPPQAARDVSGRVVDQNGQPLTGVTVMVEGTMTGTTTGAEGRYTLNVPAGGSELSFSFIGYEKITVPIGGRTSVNVTLGESNIAMDNIVVTAMGIRREEKSLTYNVQSIGAGEISKAKDPNFMNSLAGKLAGVTINQSASGLGGSTRVVMRGPKSLFGNNNALYVLDGIPLADMKAKQSDNYMETDGGQGDSETISLLNPDDIESMTVLTGAAAAALYGNRGSNGVILITTKKGSSEGTRVNFSNSTTFSNPFVTPEFQNTYGRSGETYYSWGEKLETPSSYNPLDIYQTGANTMNTISVATGSERYLLHASLGAVNARGILPNSKYDKYNINIRTSGDLVKDKLTLDLGVNYIDQKDRNPTTQGLYYNPIVAAYLFPPGDDFQRYVPWRMWDSERNFYVQNWPYQDESLEGVKQNPLWTANRNVFDNKRERTILTGALNYTITDWINIAFRARMDRANSRFERKLYASSHTLFTHGRAGNYSEYALRNQNLYADFLINIDKELHRDLRLVANLGGSFNDEQYRYSGYKGPLISVVDFFHMSNTDVEEKETENYHTRTNSWYGTAQLGYRNILYLDLTGRMDYFSTLAGVAGKVWEFYPSIGGSFVVSEVLPVNNSILPLWKIRTSYSQVGNPPEPYLTRNYTSLNNGAIENSAFPLTDLKVEKTKAFEIGTDVRLFGNLLDLSFTYYNTNTYNQLFQYNLPPSTGYAYAYANAGKVNNWGIELTLGLRRNIGPVKWDGTFTYSLNRNKIKELLGEYVLDPVSQTLMEAPTEYEVASANGTYRMVLTEGGTMSDIYVTTFKRDLNGHIYVNPGTGMFEIDGENSFKIGEASPKYNLSYRNNFEWNGVSLGFMLDARVGGVVVSSTQALLDQYGVSKQSAQVREKGGVPINMGVMNAESYYNIVAGGTNGNALAEYTYSATTFRLKELTLGYNLPSKWFRDKADISVSLFARNLWMFYCKAPFDPEITANTGTYYQGYDYFMPPSLRTFGFGINLSF